jgi:hypothetical protein
MNNNKKRYTIYLDEKPKLIVQKYLRTTAGMSFSWFVNVLLEEFAKEIQGRPAVFDKKISEMTLEEYGRLMSYWFTAVKEKGE